MVLQMLFCIINTQYRIDCLADEMNILYKTLEKHKRNPELLRYKRSLRATLSSGES